MPKMNWSKLLNEKRPASTKPFHRRGRTGFQSDMDRIVFSSAFRRLQGKTQVHPLPKNDHVHNRLTHSLEAASVARTLGTEIGKNLKEEKDELPKSLTPYDVGSIVQAAALAHDIGNPPFGHACEDAIGEWFEGWIQEKETEFKDFLSEDEDGFLSEDEADDLKLFDGNAQGFRTLVHLEKRLGKRGGLRLSYPTLAAFLKYPWIAANAPKNQKHKTSAFLSEQDYLEKVAKKVGLIQIKPGQWCRHPLAYLTEAADDICYSTIDVEDALALGILGPNDYQALRDVLGSGSGSVQKISTPEKMKELLASHRGILFEKAISAVIESFFANYDEIMEGEFEGDLLSESGDKAAKYIRKALKIGRNRIYKEPRKSMIEIGVSRNVETTLGTFCDAALDHVIAKKNNEKLKGGSKKVMDHLQSNGMIVSDDLYSCLRGVIDSFSGMTDRHAVHMTRQISGHVD